MTPQTELEVAKAIRDVEDPFELAVEFCPHVKAVVAKINELGYAIVPKEPTDEMADKGESSLICGPLPSDLETSPSPTWAQAKSCYRAMIAANF